MLRSTHEWAAEISLLIASVWFAIFPFTGKTARKLVQKNTKELQRKLKSEIFAGKSKLEILIFALSETIPITILFLLAAIIWIVGHLLTSWLNVSLQSPPDTNFLITTAKATFFGKLSLQSPDTNFLIATAQATLLGVVVPITTALADRNDVGGYNDELLRDARYKFTKFRTFILSAALLLIFCGIAESFLDTTISHYLALLVWFSVNLLLFGRIIVIQIDRNSYTALFAKEFAKKVETSIGQIAVHQTGDRFDD